jgi:hypothetical protein
MNKIKEVEIIIRINNRYLILAICNIIESRYLGLRYIVEYIWLKSRARKYNDALTEGFLQAFLSRG